MILQNTRTEKNLKKYSEEEGGIILKIVTVKVTKSQFDTALKYIKIIK